METLKETAIISFNENQLQNVRKAVGYEDLNKLKQDIQLLEDWIKQQDHFKVKEFDQDYLERLLIYNKGSIERTKQRFDKFCTSVTLMPDFLQGFDIQNEFKPLFNVMRFFVLPKPTEDNYRLLILDFTGKDDNNFSIIQLYRFLMVLGHYMLNNDYCQGYEWISDSTNMTMSTITKCNPIVIHKGLTLYTEAMGQRLKKIHLLSGSKYFDAVMTLCKQALSAKLKDRLEVHSNVDHLCQHIPKTLLPKDLGGDQKSFNILQDGTIKEFGSDKHIESVKFMETIGTDESHRNSYKFNEEYCGMPGSFKKLCVD